MNSEYPFKSLVLKAAREVSASQPNGYFNYSSLRSHLKDGTKDIKMSSIHTAGSLLLRGDYIRLVRKLNNGHVYELTTKGKTANWKCLPSESELRKQQKTKECKKKNVLMSTDELTLSKVGEAIHIYIEVLKKEICKLTETIQTKENAINSVRNDMRSFKTTIKNLEEANEELRETIRKMSGKTFSMSEVATVVREGRM